MRIRAERDTEWCATGMKVTDAELAAVPLTPHESRMELPVSASAQSISR